MLLASQALGACAILGTGTENLTVPANVKAYAERVPRVDNSVKLPCWAQRQIAKQRAFLDATVEGNQKVYVADCDQKPQKRKATS